MEVHERARIAVLNNSILFIDIHSDASNDYSAKGVTVIGAIETEVDAELGNLIADSVSDSMGTSNRGYITKRGSNRPNWYGAIHYSKGVLYRYILERGFHTNSSDLTKLKDPSNIRLTAENLANTIISYFNR